MEGLAIFGVIAVFIAMTFVWCILEHLLHRKPTKQDGETDKVRLFAYTGPKGLARGLVIGLISALTMFFSGRISGALWLAPVFFAVMLLIDLYICYRFVGNDKEPGGEDAAEVVWFSIMTLLVYWAMRPAAVAFATLVHSAFWGAIIRTFPFWLWIGTVFFFIGDALFYHSKKADDGEDRKVLKVLFYIFFALALATLIMGIFIPAYKNWNVKPTLRTVDTVTATPAPTTTPTPTVTPAPTPTPTPTPVPIQVLESNTANDREGEFVLTNDDWYYLRHWDVIGGDKEDDDNFGKNPLDEILADKVARGELTVKDISGKTEKELYGLVTFDELFKKFVEELEKDPVKGAAVMGYYDVLRGTNFLGSFSTELLDHKDALMEKINEKAREWLQDQDGYIKVLTAFVAALQRSDEIEINYVSSGLDDQMYMFGLTPDHVPIVVVMESTNHSGWFLTFRDFIKGTTKVEVSYRIDCDFQPTNVGKVAPVTVQPNPTGGSTPPSTGGSTPPSTGGGTLPATGGGTPPTIGGGTTIYIWYPDPPVPPVTNPKDPTKGTDVGKNSGGGPGPDTNNGVGAQFSTEEEPTNSIHESLVGYWEDIEDLKEDTEVPGDPNTPSYTPPAGTNPAQDNNGNTGTGNGNADQAMPTSPDVTYTDPKTGENKSFDDEGPGKEWELSP